MPHDGVSLDSVNHPNPPWHQRPGLWLRRLRTRLFGFRGLVDGVLSFENLPGAWGINNTIRRWERKRIVGSLRDDVAARAKASEGLRIKHSNNEGNFALRLAEGENAIERVEVVSRGSGWVDVAPEPGMVLVSSGDGGPWSWGWPETRPVDVPLDAAAEYLMGVIGVSWNALRDGRHELPPWGFSTALRNGFVGKDNVRDVVRLILKKADREHAEPLAAEAERMRKALAMISYMSAQSSEDALKMREIATDVAMWRRPESMWWYGKDYGPNKASADTISPWHPMTDPVALKHLGKLGEECNELGSAASRCIIQGIDEAHPVTGKPNKLWFEEEIADVLANIELCIEHFELDSDAIAIRKYRKLEGLRKWHAEA